jgi:sec-independent protein translocase protein TatA
LSLEEFEMGLGFKEILIIAVVMILLFGRGKISEMMGDVAKGIKSFKKGISEEDAPETGPAPRIETKQPAPVETEKHVDRQG